MTTILSQVSIGKIYDFKVNGIAYKLIDETTMEVGVSNDNDQTIRNTSSSSGYEVHASSYSGLISIPSEITYGGKTFHVTSIEKYAFYECINLKKVILPENIQSIGMSSFTYSSIEEIDLPESISEIGEGAFSSCVQIRKIVIPSNIEKLNEYTFYGCEKLKEVTFPKSLKQICNNCFGYTAIERIELPEGLEYLGSYNMIHQYGGPFACANNLQVIILPSTLQHIHQWTFAGCESLKTIILKSNNISISDYDLETAFSGTDIDYLIVPNNTLENYSNWPIKNVIESSYDITDRIGKEVIWNNQVFTIVYENEKMYTYLSNMIYKDATEILIPSYFTINGETYYTIGISKRINDYSSILSVKTDITEPFDVSDDVFNSLTYIIGTLYIPIGSINIYQNHETWKKFSNIKEEYINFDKEIEIPVKQKCETPTISFVDGKLTFSCATEGVEYASEVTCSDVNKYYSNEINLAACYDITVTAMKTGYDNSDVATAKLYWLTSSGSLEGAGINNVSMRGIAIQSAGGFITISGLDNNEKVSFYGIDGKSLGSATAINGTTSFAAQSGSIVVAKIGKENIKIAVK